MSPRRQSNGQYTPQKTSWNSVGSIIDPVSVSLGGTESKMPMKEDTCPRLAQPSAVPSASTRTLAAWPRPLPCVLKEDQEQDVATTTAVGSDVNLAGYPELHGSLSGGSTELWGSLSVCVGGRGSYGAPIALQSFIALTILFLSYP